MTNNQIQYQRNLEQERTNRVNEQYRGKEYQMALERGLRQDTETERHNQQVEAESARHNSADEQLRAHANQIASTRSDRDYALGQSQLAETMRSNAERERLQSALQAETRRANLQRENLTQQQVQESIRSALERERLMGQQITQGYVNTAVTGLKGLVPVAAATAGKAMSTLAGSAAAPVLGGLALSLGSVGAALAPNYISERLKAKKQKESIISGGGLIEKGDR